MLKQFLATLGIGATKVNLHLKQDHLIMGEEAVGHVELEGGKVAQEIDNLTIHLFVRSKYYGRRKDQTDRFTELVTSVPIHKGRSIIDPHQKRTIPISFTCPENLAVSSKMTEYYFQTVLTIPDGKNSVDVDPISIKPSGLLKNFLDACKSLKMSWIHEGYTGRNRSKESKQFIYFLPPRMFRDRLEEILLVFNPHDTQQGVYGHYEFIPKGKKPDSGLTELIKEFTEEKARYHFSPEQLATREIAMETIRRWIAEHYKRQ